MPNPHPEEPDPLLAFCEEHLQTQPAEPVKRAQVAENEPLTGVLDRLDRTDRQLERALTDVTALKNDLATLVSAVAEIQKRLSRPHDKPAPVITTRQRKAGSTHTVAAAVMLMALGVAGWGLTSTMTYDAPQTPQLESRPAQITELPQNVEAQPPNASAPALTPDITAAPVRAINSPPRVVSYVGTLTIDAEPAGDVFVNRKRVGRTPMRLEDLRAGSHLIWIEREGYRRWTRVVAVAADRISRVSVSLEPLSR